MSDRPTTVKPDRFEERWHTWVRGLERLRLGATQEESEELAEMRGRIEEIASDIADRNRRTE